jgi:acetyltransferase-like isoleucine patch superfamily enzyme
MSDIAPTAILNAAKVGKGTKVWHYANLYGCEIGENCVVGSYAEIGTGVTIGNNTKIEAGAFIPPGVTIGSNVFVGPHAVFTNDLYPRSGGAFKLVKTVVEDGASIGANATIICGTRIGKGAMVAAGAVVTKDVPANTLVMGVPAKAVRRLGK